MALVLLRHVKGALVFATIYQQIYCFPSVNLKHCTAPLLGFILAL